MEWVQGDLVDVARERNLNLIAFTANSVIKIEDEKYKLVMGRGAAKRVRDAFPGVDAMLASRLLEGKDLKSGLQPDYYCIGAKYNDGLSIAAVQTKRHWHDVGYLDLAKQSLEALRDNLKRKSNLRAVLNCPLIENGGFADRLEIVREMVKDVFDSSDIVICTLL